LFCDFRSLQTKDERKLGGGRTHGQSRQPPTRVFLLDTYVFILFLQLLAFVGEIFLRLLSDCYTYNCDLFDNFFLDITIIEVYSLTFYFFFFLKNVGTNFGFAGAENLKQPRFGLFGAPGVQQPGVDTHFASVLGAEVFRLGACGLWVSFSVLDRRVESAAASYSSTRHIHRSLHCHFATL
jgi:hypothetical protein